jgi:hypothetical protein
MNAHGRTSLLLAGICLLCGCRSTGVIGRATSIEPQSMTETRTAAKHDQHVVKGVSPSVIISNSPSLSPQRVRPLYILKACGAFIGPTNAPNSTPAHLSFARLGSNTDYNNFGDVAFFRLSNGENRSILLWSVRVQIRSPDSKHPDPPGWQTIADDYPEGTTKPNIPPGSSDELRVRRPVGETWRVCIVYSKDWTGTGTTYGGDYELISEEIKE